MVHNLFVKGERGKGHAEISSAHQINEYVHYSVCLAHGFHLRYVCFTYLHIATVSVANKASVNSW